MGHPFQDGFDALVSRRHGDQDGGSSLAQRSVWVMKPSIYLVGRTEHVQAKSPMAVVSTASSTPSGVHWLS